MAPILVERAANYRTLISHTMVNALREAFNSGYKDAQFANVKITPKYPLKAVDYPSIVFEYEGRGIYNMGVGHEEWFNDALGVLRKWHHRRFEGTANFTIYALSPLDRDIFADGLVEVLSFGRLDAALAPFFTTIYGDPTANFDFQTMFSQLALNIDEIEEASVNATIAPWSPEDVLVYSIGYSCDLHGGFYNVVPSPNWPKVTKVATETYPQFNVNVNGTFQTVPPVDLFPAAVWTNPFEYADTAVVKGVGASSGPDPHDINEPPTTAFGRAVLSAIENASIGDSGTASGVGIASGSELTGGSLTLSGNEITDVTRAAILGTGSSGQMMDGRTNDSSVAIRRAATNLFRQGQCNSNVDWNTLGPASVTRATDATVPPPFSTQSVKYIVDGSGIGQGARPSSATGLAASAGTVGVGSVYFKGVGGSSYKVRMRWANTDASNTDGTDTTFTATGAWQLLTPTSLQVAVGKTGDALHLIVITSSARAESFWVAHAMLESGQSVISPYVATTSAATATHSASRAQIPSTFFNATQSWLAQRIRVGFGASLAPGNGAGFPGLFDWRQDANNRLSVYYTESSLRWAMESRNAGAADIAASAVQSFNTSDFLTIIAAWTASFVFISVNGGAFASTTRTLGVPTISNALADFGSLPGFTINSDEMWTAVGTGTLADADAATIHGFGNTDKIPSDFPGSCTAIWPANTAVFYKP